MSVGGRVCLDLSDEAELSDVVQDGIVKEGALVLGWRCLRIRQET